MPSAPCYHEIGISVCLGIMTTKHVFVVIESIYLVMCVLSFNALHTAGWVMGKAEKTCGAYSSVFFLEQMEEVVRRRESANPALPGDS